MLSHCLALEECCNVGDNNVKKLKTSSWKIMNVLKTVVILVIKTTLKTYKQTLN